MAINKLLSDLGKYSFHLVFCHNVLKATAEINPWGPLEAVFVELRTFHYS
jgi:hypothetical protein